MAIISDNDDENLKMASSIQSVMEKNGSPELLLNVAIKADGDSITILKIMKDSKVRTVVLLSQPVLTSALLSKAKLYGLINMNCTWILGVMQTAQVLDHSDPFLDLPSEIIELKFTGRHDAFVSFDYFMEDSIAIFQKALQHSKTFNVRSQEHNFYQDFSKYVNLFCDLFLSCFIHSYMDSHQFMIFMHERFEWRSLNNNYVNDITLSRDGIILSNLDLKMKKEQHSLQEMQ